jgi:hypothetical protein
MVAAAKSNAVEMRYVLDRAKRPLASELAGLMGVIVTAGLISVL